MMTAIWLVSCITGAAPFYQGFGSATCGAAWHCSMLQHAIIMVGHLPVVAVRLQRLMGSSASCSEVVQRNAIVCINSTVRSAACAHGMLGPAFGMVAILQMDCHAAAYVTPS
jgi:hypothetical protein